MTSIWNFKNNTMYLINPCWGDSYGTLFLSHIAEDINDSLYFSGKLSTLAKVIFVQGIHISRATVFQYVLFSNEGGSCGSTNKYLSEASTDGVPKEGLRIQDVLVRLAILHLIRDKVRPTSISLQFSIKVM